MHNSPCSHCGLTGRAFESLQSPWNVLELLRSGHRPPSISASSVADRVAALETRQDQLQDDVDHLKLLIRQKKTEIAATRTEIKQTKSLAAPIRAMPTEILLRIFLLVCATRQSNMDPRKFPCRLGHVCKFWRTLSRSSPSLWSNIRLEVFLYATGYSYDVLQQHIFLSIPRPLDIHVVYPKYRDSRSSQSWETAMEAFSTHVSRWRSFKIDAPEEMIDLFFEYISGVEMKTLESLTVRYNERYYEPPVRLKACRLVLPPSLHSLDMNLSFRPFKSVRAQWSALTSFAGPFCGPDSFYQFIVDAYNLVSLKVYCIGYVRLHQSKDLFVHENLRRLTLNVSCSMSPVLDDISLPSLVELVITHQQEGEYHDTCASNNVFMRHTKCGALLRRLVERSACRLQTLSIDSHLRPLSTKLAPIFRLSSVTSLSVNLGFEYLPLETTAFLDSLTVTPSNRLFPNLRELEITANSPDDDFLADDQLRVMILSRWNVAEGVARLSKLALSRNTCLEDPVPKYHTSLLASLLLDLQDHGLDVSWKIKDLYGSPITNLLRRARKYAQSIL